MVGQRLDMKRRILFAENRLSAGCGMLSGILPVRFSAHLDISAWLD